MLYQLSHVRNAHDNLATGAATGNLSAALVGRPEVHTQDQEAVLDGARRVAEHGEVTEIHLRLAYELRPFLARDRRQRALLHRMRTLLEARDHRVDVEGVSHAPTVPAGRGGHPR